MTFQLAVRNAPIRATDAWKPLDLVDRERRGRTVSFLTWAFFLSEAFKGSEAFGGTALAAASPDPLPWSGTTDNAVAPLLAGDELALRDWSFSFPGEGTIPGPIAHAYVPPLSTGQFEKLNLGEGAASPPQPGAGAYGDGNAAHAQADLHDGIHAASFGLQGNLDLELFDVHADVGLAVGVDGLMLPLFGRVDHLLSVLGDDPPPSAPGAQLADVIAPVVGGLDLLGDGLAGGVLASGGVVSFSGSQTTDGVDTMFVDGRYTDYNLALQAQDGADIGGRLPDMGNVHLIDDVVPLNFHDSDHDMTSQRIGLPSAMEELHLRGSIDHLL